MNCVKSVILIKSFFLSFTYKNTHLYLTHVIHAIAKITPAVSEDKYQYVDDWLN